MTKFKLIHLLYITALILLGGYCLLWFFHHHLPNPYPNIEFYKLLLVYFSVIFVTAYAFSTQNILKIHRVIGFHYSKVKYLILALLGGSIVWTLDYYYQIKILHVNMQEQALNWSKQQNNISSAFLTTVFMAPVIEEMLFRGVLFQTINKYLNTLLTAVLLSIIFSLLHFSFIQALPLFVVSFFYFWISYKSNSIIPAILAHILNNALTFYYYLSFKQ